MRVLVTNDDGVESAGIVALTKALHDAGHDVFVVAPASDLSGAGASIGPLHRSEPDPGRRAPLGRAPGRPGARDRAPARDRGVPRVPRRVRRASGRRRLGHQPGREHRSPHPALGHGRRRADRGRARRPRPRGERQVERDGLLLGDRGAARGPGARLGGSAGDGAPRILNLNVPNVADRRGPRRPRGRRWRPYGEFWVASSDIRSGDLRIEFQGPAIDPDGETPMHRSSSRGTRRSHRCSGSSRHRSRERPKSVENALERDSFAQHPDAH